MKLLIAALAAFVLVNGHAESHTIPGVVFRNRLAVPPPCFVAATAASNLHSDADLSPNVYCIWEKYEAGALSCRLSGYDLETGRFTENLPNGESAFEVPGACLNGGIERLMKINIKGQSTRKRILAEARPYHWCNDRCLTQFLGPVNGNPKGMVLYIQKPQLASKPPDLEPPGSSQLATTPAESPTQPFTTVKVFFATDREEDKSGFNNNRNKTGNLQYGISQVSIPFTHQLATLESPSIFHLEFSEDPKSHIVVRSVTKLDPSAFARELQDKVSASPEKDAFVFIHGYNNTFEDSLRRAAQMAYDLNFHGAPIVYSWPSGDEAYKYSVAETNVDWTFQHLAKFLSSLPQISGARKIHVIAHSMGNRALTYALNQMMTKQPVKLFNQIVLAAPDIDAEVFGQIAEQVRAAGDRITIYASKNDEALQISQKFHSYARLGQAGDAVFSTAFSDTVDTSSLPSGIMGHSYFGDDENVVKDIGLLVRKGLEPANRPSLIEKTNKESVYWKFELTKKEQTSSASASRDNGRSTGWERGGTTIVAPNSNFENRFFFPKN